MKNNRFLIVAAHPDDEILGCFGTAAKLIKMGFEGYTLILGEGKTSRDDLRNPAAHKNDFEILKNEAKRANELIGIKRLIMEHFSDNRFDSHELLDIVKVVERAIKEIKPSIVFTHFEDDLNIDHQITARAVLTATRPIKDCSVKVLFAFEVLSSTEWRFNKSFAPNFFVDISSEIDLKIAAMSEYKSELCDYPHPRSLNAIKAQGALRGSTIEKAAAEAFMLVRGVADFGLFDKNGLKDFTALNEAEKWLVLSWRNSENIGKFMHHKTIHYKEHFAFLEALKNDSTRKYFLAFDEAKPIGVVYLTAISAATADFGVYKNPQLSGVGEALMSLLENYAFENLGVQKLTAEVYSQNKTALKLYEKRGFKVVENSGDIIKITKILA